MMQRRDWLLLLLAGIFGVIVFIGNRGIYPRVFYMEWNEEVRLHDGRVIEARIKRSFERYRRFDRWSAGSVDTEIEFDHGPPLGRITHIFQRYDVNMIETKNGNWYFGLDSTTGIPPVKLVTQEYPVLILKPDGTKYSAQSWNDIPNFPRQNIMPVTPSVKEISKFENTLLTWDTKMNHWEKNPRAAGDNGMIIQRPEE